MIAFLRARCGTLRFVFFLAALTCAIYAVGSRLWPGGLPRAGGEFLVTASLPWSSLALTAGQGVLARVPAAIAITLGYAALAFGFALNATAATALTWYVVTGRGRRRR